MQFLSLTLITLHSRLVTNLLSRSCCSKEWILWSMAACHETTVTHIRICQNLSAKTDLQLLNLWLEVFVTFAFCCLVLAHERQEQDSCIAGIRLGDLSKSVQLRKIWNQAEFTTSIKNSNTHCAGCIEKSHFVNVAKCACDQCSILVQFNNFALTMGFYWSTRSYSSCPFLWALGMRISGIVMWRD